MTGLTHAAAAPQTPARVVVLGARGFVGRAILVALARRGIAVLPLTSAELDLIGPRAADDLAGRLTADDALVISAALTPDRGRDIAAFMKNLQMMQAICAALAKQPVAQVVHVGSDAVYADAASLVDEATPPSPNSLYGMMDAAREVMLASSLKLPLALLRPTILYGVGDTHNAYGPNRFRRTAAAEQRILLFGNGEEQRDHTHVDDVAELIVRVVAHRSAGVLNLATGRSASFREVAELVAAACKTPVEIVPQPRAPGAAITHRHFDIAARLRAFPEFQPRALAAGIAQVQEAERG